MSELRLQRIGCGLSLAGIAIATYITLASTGNGAPVCLTGGHGCQTVADSAYAELAGIRVSAIGVAGYVALFVAMAASGDPARFAAVLLALVGFGFSVYLTYLELFVIDAICQWCVASAGVMTALLVVASMRGYRFVGAGLSNGPSNPRLETPDA